MSEPTTGECEHVTVRSHLPYDGDADCVDCGATVLFSPNAQETSDE